MGHRKLKQQETPAAHPVVTISRCVPAFAAWVFMVTFVYDGEPFDYLYEVGPINLSEPDAVALAQRSNYLGRAQRMFLTEVHLGPQHNDVELRTA